jgi:hypothetical protein
MKKILTIIAIAVASQFAHAGDSSAAVSAGANVNDGNSSNISITSVKRISTSEVGSMVMDDGDLVVLTINPCWDSVDTDWSTVSRKKPISVPGIPGWDHSIVPDLRDTPYVAYRTSAVGTKKRSMGCWGNSLDSDGTVATIIWDDANGAADFYPLAFIKQASWLENMQEQFMLREAKK